MNIIQSLIPQKGITLDGISFYYCEGELRMRKAGGPSKKIIQKRASCKGIRNNNAEFGCASTMSKMFRNNLGTDIKQYADSKISSRLTGIFRTIIQAGAGEPGRRSFNPHAHMHLLNGFEFNRIIAFDLVCKSRIESSFCERTSEMTFTASICMKDDFNAPACATHVMLKFSVMHVPVVTFNSRTNTYALPSERSNAFECLSVQTDHLLLTDDSILNLNLKIPLSSIVTSQPGSWVSLYGISFYKGTSVLPKQNAMYINYDANYKL